MSRLPTPFARLSLVGFLSTLLFGLYLMIYIPAADSLFARKEIAAELIEQLQTIDEMKKLAYQMSDASYRAQQLSQLLLSLAVLFSCWVAFLFALNLYFFIKLKKCQP